MTSYATAMHCILKMLIYLMSKIYTFLLKWLVLICGSQSRVEALG